MNADLILGPAGALPPGEWAAGARVVCSVNGARGVVAESTREHGLRVWSPAGYRADWGKRDIFALDLTTGCLSFGTRALLAQVAPEAEQPDNPVRFMPEWGTSDFCLTLDARRRGSNGVIQVGCRLWFHVRDGRAYRGRMETRHYMQKRAFNSGDLELRRALSLALHAAVSAKEA